MNPLSLESDESQFSPNNINTKSRENVVRIYKVITSWNGKRFDLQTNSPN